MLLLFLSASTYAEDFRTNNGKEYPNAVIIRQEPDGIVVRSKSGISKLYFVELPDEVQKRFHYDPIKVTAVAAPSPRRTPEPKEQVRLDVPAKTPEVTLRSEIRRGFEEAWAAEVGDDAWGTKRAVERMIQQNDRIGRKTDGYVIGAEFGLWLKLEIGWEVYHDQAKANYEAVASSVWMRLQVDLSQEQISFPQLTEVVGGGDVIARKERWEKRQ